jgi:CHAD domain-containing protein
MNSQVPPKVAHHILLSASHKSADESIDHLTKDIAEWLAGLEEIDMNEEVVHDLRVVIRQLKSLMYFFKPLFRKATYRRGQSLLSDALHTFETARESAVLLEALEDFEKNSKIQDEGLIKAVSALKFNVQDTHEGELRAAQNMKAGSDWRAQVEDWIHLMRQDPYKSKKVRIQTKKFAQRRIQLLMLQWLSNYQSLSLEDDILVHNSRIACKKLRYMLRAMSGTLVKKSPALLSSLAAYQDRAGQLHDISRFKEMMSNVSQSEQSYAINAFIQYEEGRERQLREETKMDKYHLEKEIMHWIEDHKHDVS